MAAGGMVIVVVLELFLYDLPVVLFFLLFLFAVTRAGAIRHGGVLMGCVGGILLAGRRVGGGHERGMEGVRERLIILSVHDFLGGLRDKSPEMDVTLRAESNRCRQQQPNPVGTVSRRICPSTRRASHRFQCPQKMPENCAVVLHHSEIHPSTRMCRRKPGQHSECIPGILACPIFVPMAKTRGDTAAGTRVLQAQSQSHTGSQTP